MTGWQLAGGCAVLSLFVLGAELVRYIIGKVRG